MKKKIITLFAIVATLAMTIPYGAVNAISGNYYEYGVGDEVNFYAYEGDTTGISSIVLEDEGTSAQYVKTFLIGFQAATTKGSAYVYCDSTAAGSIAACQKFEHNGGSEAYDALTNYLNSEVKNLAGHAKYENDELVLSTITLDDLKNVFGATASSDGETYTIDATKWGAKLYDIAAIEIEAEGMGFKGFYTGTVTDDGKVWVVEFTFAEGATSATAEDAAITAITVKKVDINSTSTKYAVIPVVYMDKTYDCHYNAKTETEYACYVCDGDEDNYSWIEKGTQGSSCEVVENITSKGKCVKPAPTGLNDYILPVTIIACVGAIALTIITKKSSFKGV